MSVAPLHRSEELPRVRIDEQFMRIEAVAFLRIVRPVHTVPIQQSGARFGQIAVPNLVRILGQRDLFEFAPPARVEGAQFDLLGMRREEREVDAASVPCRAERIGAARQNFRAAERFQCAPSARSTFSNTTAASGGSVKAIDHGRPWDSICSAWISPFATPLPP